MKIDFRKMVARMERVKRFSFAIKMHGVNGSVIVDQNTANIRAETCAACHNNVPMVEALSGCTLSGSEERKVMDRVLREIIQDRATAHDHKLKTCNVDGCENKVAVWMFPEYLLKKHDANAFPCFCWKKSVL